MSERARRRRVLEGRIRLFCISEKFPTPLGALPHTRSLSHSHQPLFLLLCRMKIAKCNEVSVADPADRGLAVMMDMLFMRIHTENLHVEIHSEGAEKRTCPQQRQY